MDTLAEDAEDDDQDDDMGEGSTLVGGSGPSERSKDATPFDAKRPRKCYFAADRINASNVSAWVVKCQSWSTAPTSLIQKLQCVSKDCEGRSDKERAILRPTLMVVQSRLRALELVGSAGGGVDGQAALREYQKSIADGRSKQSPPIENYMDLMTDHGLGNTQGRTTTCRAPAPRMSRVSSGRSQEVPPPSLRCLLHARGSWARWRGRRRGWPESARFRTSRIPPSKPHCRRADHHSSELASLHAEPIVVFKDSPSDHDKAVGMVKLDIPVVISDCDFFKTANRGRMATAKGPMCSRCNLLGSAACAPHQSVVSVVIREVPAGGKPEPSHESECGFFDKPKPRRKCAVIPC